MAQARPTTDPVYQISLNQSLAVRLTVWGTLLLYVGFQIVDSLFSTPAKAEFFRTFGKPASMAWFSVAATIVTVSTLILHEIIHGLAFRWFGGKPKYGAGLASKVLPYAYATSPGDAFTLFEMSIVGAAPFVVISAATVALMMAFPDFAILAAVAFIVNFSGAVGDLWLLTMIWRFRRCSDLALVDTMTGMLIHTPDPAAATIVSRLQSPSRVVFFERLYRFVLVWGIAALVGLVIATIGVAVLLDWLVESDFKSLVIGPDSFPLLSFSQTPTELSFLLDYRFLAFVTMVFPLLDLWGQVRWGSPAPKSRPRHDGVPRPAVL